MHLPPTPTRRSAGQALAEFALVVPVLFLLLGAIIQFGIVFWNQNTLNQIVRDAGRYAATVADCSTDSRDDVVLKTQAIADAAPFAGTYGTITVSSQHSTPWMPAPQPATLTSCGSQSPWMRQSRTSSRSSRSLPSPPRPASAWSPRMSERSRGQVLPLFALMLVALLGIAALAIDVSNALQARRALPYRRRRSRPRWRAGSAASRDACGQHRRLQPSTGTRHSVTGA